MMTSRLTLMFVFLCASGAAAQAASSRSRAPRVVVMNAADAASKQAWTEHFQTFAARFEYDRFQVSQHATSGAVDAQTGKFSIRLKKHDRLGQRTWFWSTGGLMPAVFGIAHQP